MEEEECEQEMDLMRASIDLLENIVVLAYAEVGRPFYDFFTSKVSSQNWKEIY